MSREAMQREYMRLKSDAKGRTVDWGFVAHFQRTAVEAAAKSAAGVLAATALTAAAQSITANITGPPAPRNIEVVGNAAGIVGDVVITGTAYDGSIITETLVLNGTTAVIGSKAFLDVTQIDLPIQTNAGTDTVSVGFGDKLGIPFELAMDTVQSAFLNNTKEGTSPTVTVDAANIENNTVTLNSVLNGTAVDVFLIV